jgi:lipoprotein-anchoring transpeptidase ErfK/SrfK
VSILSPLRRLRRFRFWSRWWALLLLVVALSASAGAGAVLTVDHVHSGRLLPGVRVMGVDVGTMRRSEAVAAVRRRLAFLTSRVVEVHVGTDRARVALSELGADGDVEDAVDEAYADVSGVDSIRRAWRFVRGERTSLDIPVAVSPDPRRLTATSRRVADSLDRPAKDAHLEIVDGKVVLDQGVPGRRVEALDVAAALEAVTGSLMQASPLSVEVRASVIPRAVTESDFPVAIVVRIDQQKLDYYEKGQLTHEFPVASGKSGYDTPLGDWSVTEKLVDPSWYNPAPTSWGRGMPAFIGPGPGNPLGTHAIGISSPGIFLHETLGPVGSPASHGCLRMRPSDIQSVFEQVPLGAPVLIMDGPVTYTPDAPPAGAGGAPSGGGATGPAGASV